MPKISRYIFFLNKLVAYKIFLAKYCNFFSKQNNLKPFALISEYTYRVFSSFYIIPVLFISCFMLMIKIFSLFFASVFLCIICLYANLYAAYVFLRCIKILKNFYLKFLYGFPTFVVFTLLPSFFRYFFNYFFIDCIRNFILYALFLT